MKKAKKGSRVIGVTIGLMCFVLVYVMFMQFKTVGNTDIKEIEMMRETELRESLTSWKAKYEDTNQKLADTTEKINEYTEKIESNQEASEVLEKELEQLNVALGKTNVKGEGIVVTLMNNDNADISAYDLLLLVNELKNAGAEAISINDERVITTTDIVDISTMFIQVNGQRLTSPYVVKAIGNQNYLESAIVIKNGFVDYMEGYDKTVKVEKTKNKEIQILKYNGEMKLKYMNTK